MAASLTEEELARLEYRHRTRSVDMREYLELLDRCLPVLLASARAVRKVGEVLNDLKRVATLHAQAGDGVTSGALLAAVASIRGALTATAEPTDGEDDHAAK